MDQSLYLSLPTTPGVYLFKDANGKIIYVGKAKDLKSRVSTYFSNKPHDTKTTKLINEIRDLSFVLVNSEIEAFLLEATLIKKHKPFFNIKLLDDKSFPYVEITANNNPSVTITRKQTDTTAKYFGPYSDATALKTVLKLLRKAFPYQSIKSHPKRKCLYFHLGLCPCISVNKESLLVYKLNLKRIEKFLGGKKNEVLNTLLREQRSYIKREEFENAKLIQDKIDRINLITSSTFSPFHYMDKPDFYFERIEKETASLREILQPYWNIKKLERIECYDISNFQGKQATGSMVVFNNGEKEGKEYRRFKIKTKDTPDDFHMIKEMLQRRIRKQEWKVPDLIVIDGGKGQVGAALKALANLGKRLPVIGLAKREEIIVIPIKKRTGIEFEEIKLSHSTPGVNLLRRIRDEAHRFAITYHMLLRRKNFLPEKH